MNCGSDLTKFGSGRIRLRSDLPFNFQEATVIQVNSFVFGLWHIVTVIAVVVIVGDILKRYGAWHPGAERWVVLAVFLVLVVEGLVFSLMPPKVVRVVTGTGFTLVLGRVLFGVKLLHLKLWACAEIGLSVATAAYTMWTVADVISFRLCS